MEITGMYRRITRWRLLGRIGGLLDGDYWDVSEDY